MWILLVYKRIYAEDGAILSKTPVFPGDPFLGASKLYPCRLPTLSKLWNTALQKLRTSKTGQTLVSSFHPTANHPCAKEFTIRNCIGLGSTLTPSPRCKDVRFRTKRREAPWSPKGGVDLRVLQSLVHRQRVQRSDIVRPFNTLLLFLFVLTSQLLGGSVLSTLRRRLWNAIESSLLSKETFPWSYPGWFCRPTTESRLYQTVHFESGESPCTCSRRSFCRHIMRYSIDRTPHLSFTRMAQVWVRMSQCSKSTTSANHWHNLSTWSVLLFNLCNPCNTFSWWVSSVQEIISVNSNHHFEKSLYNLFQWLIYSTHCIFPWVQKPISAAASSTKVVGIYQIYLSFSEHHPSSIQQNTSIPSIFPLVLNTTTQLARPESATLCGTCTCYVVVSLRSLQVGVPSSLDKQLQERICSWCQCGLGALLISLPPFGI